MTIIKHLCKNAGSRSYQKVSDHYTEIQVRIDSSKDRILYMWKPLDNVGFVIQFCPFCGIPSKEICDEFPDKEMKHCDYCNLPLPNNYSYQQIATYKGEYYHFHYMCHYEIIANAVAGWRHRDAWMQIMTQNQKGE